MIDEDESNPISILFTVIIVIIMMGVLLLVAGTVVDKNLVVFEGVIEPGLSSWGAGMYSNLVTTPAYWVFIIPGFFVLVFLIWGIKSVIKKHTYGKRDDEFYSGDL